ncbi:MAG: hypothetical protein Kow0022_01280 [Phycisphaerales bacterium]
MGLIRRADAEHLARDAVVLDLSRLEQQRDALLANAHEQAEQIVEAAKAERERIMAGAAEAGEKQGFQAGYAAGLAQGKAEGQTQAIESVRETLDLLVRSWAEALEQFASKREQMLRQARMDVVQLACQIASRATGRLVECEPGIAEGLLAEVLTLVSGPTRLQVRVHPDDGQILREAVPELLARLESTAHVELVCDATLARGSCVAVTDRHGIIDGSVHTRLERLIDAILERGEPDA